MKSRLEDLLVSESEVPKLLKAWEEEKRKPKALSPRQILVLERRERKEKRIRDTQCLRRLSLKGAVMDILGQGKHAWVWIGRSDGTYFCAMSPKEVTRFLMLWSQAAGV